MHDAAPAEDSVTSLGAAPSPGQVRLEADDLLLREVHHRCSNDLQLIVSLLALQSRRAANPEAREALAEAMERVAILARARTTLHHQEQNSLEAALRQVCEALQSQAEPRGIVVALEVDESPRDVPPAKAMSVALTVNELATNAIKHAFKEGKTGFIRVSLRRESEHQITVVVDDDGLPFPEIADGGVKRKGLGLDIAKRLIASIGGLLIVPTDGSKAFQLRIPIEAA